LLMIHCPPAVLLVTSAALILFLAFAGTALGVGTRVDATLVQELLVAAVWGGLRHGLVPVSDGVWGCCHHFGH